MNGLKRTDYCGTLSAKDIGREIVVAGWVQRQRDLGALIFIDLRDRTGIVQLAFDDTTDKEIFDKAFTARSEFVLMAKGLVQERSSKNMDIPTGEIEIKVTDLRVLAKSETPPFEIVENCQTSELTRLKYRYLDLRRPDLQRNILMRHKIAKITRDYFDENGFIEIETPMLIKSTPEGARDFLVPSRIHNGSFYALPQSPQLYKQLSMVAGFDRYMQIARCFRDEDLRADRQPEFTQVDVEMSFVDMEDVLEMGEGYMKRVFKEALGVEIETPLPRLTFKEAMERFGSDKPDTRYAMELYDLSDIVKDSAFSVFSSAVAGGGSVRGITAKNAVTTYTRKEIDKLIETVKGIGGKGLAWIRINEDGTFSSSFAKFMSEDEMTAIMEKADAKPGDVVLIVADSNNNSVFSVLGAVRQIVAKKLDIIPKDKFNLLWIVEFPFFDWDDETQSFVAMHHPFTSPMDECLDYLETDKANVRAKAYDLVLNGIELCSGSIRITNPDLQNRMFQLLGFSDEEAYTKFGYLLDAFKFGPPPHGGFGIGLDRLCMQMLKCETLRDVVAYPKVQNASEPMTDCPSPVFDDQLVDLGIQLLKKED
ncbi:MAG: aspartate--tRNA ligase [Clostridia bacterium]|nr:aspartate--tRNA ligase [Clostridia bacterium]